MSWASTPTLCAKLQLKLERDSWPLDYQAFNRFHHGGKVKAQDMQVMRNGLALGQQQGQRMPGLTELVQRWESAAGY